MYYVLCFNFKLTFPSLLSSQTTHNVVVVQQQQPTTVVTNFSRPVGDHYFIFSLFMVLVSLICGLILLVCTLPALFLAVTVSSRLYYNCSNLIIVTPSSLQAREDDRHGNTESALVKGRVALCLNIVAIIGWITMVTLSIAITLLNI